MKLWIDAQLPPRLGEWLRDQYAVEAGTLEELGLRQADDAAIFSALRVPGSVIVTKDEDFVDLVTRLGALPQILWLTCGNVTNRALRELFEITFERVRQLLRDGESVVNLSG